MYFYSLIENLQLRIAAPKFEFGCGFYFCVIGALKYIIGKMKIRNVIGISLLPPLKPPPNAKRMTGFDCVPCI